MAGSSLESTGIDCRWICTKYLEIPILLGFGSHIDLSQVWKGCQSVFKNRKLGVSNVCLGCPNSPLDIEKTPRHPTVSICIKQMFSCAGESLVLCLIPFFFKLPQNEVVVISLCCWAKNYQWTSSFHRLHIHILVECNTLKKQHSSVFMYTPTFTNKQLDALYWPDRALPVL